MHFSVIQRVTGILLMMFSIALVPPLLIDLWYAEGASSVFLISYLSTLLAGVVLWLPVRNVKTELRLRDGFVVVVMFWTLGSAIGALPLYLYAPLQLELVDAVFEAVSALTTTGATVMTGLDNTPHAILFHRSFLHFLGGMGIVVLAVAILPMLGIGGMQLYKAEAPGPVKGSKLTPRITETAQALWYVYLTLNLACILSLWLAGMTLFDAVNHAFTAVSLGGFSTHDQSIGYFNSPLIEAIIVIFIFLGGINFALHFVAFRKLSVMPFFADVEFRAYAILVFLIAAVCVAVLFFINHGDLEYSLRSGIFHAITIMSTTGLTTLDGYASWPGFLAVLLVFASFIGACAGSTGGGMKVIRVLLLIKQWGREMLRLIHPSSVVVVKINKTPVSEDVMNAVWGFASAYVTVIAILMLLLMATGLDQVTAFSAVAATLNNMGAGLGEVSSTFGHLNDFAKWVLTFAMLLGRLEIFTLLVLLMPAFWHK
ncbi:MAG: potassium transporter [Gammaproteobacteria bacterium]|nr:potassium transporter [Gammaproteobacteria bacterium]